MSWCPWWIVVADRSTNESENDVGSGVGDETEVIDTMKLCFSLDYLIYIVLVILLIYINALKIGVDMLTYMRNNLILTT